MTDSVHLAAFNDRGEILFTVSGSPDSVEFSLRLNTSLPYLTLSSPAVPALQYVDRGQLLPRPAGSAFMDGPLLKGVPAGAAVKIEGLIYEADGSDIELEFAYAGTYAVTVQAWPALDQEITYENHP